MAKAGSRTASKEHDHIVTPPRELLRQVDTLAWMYANGQYPGIVSDLTNMRDGLRERIKEES